MSQAEYFPAVFDAPNVEAAKAIILTPECGQTTEERWLTETPRMADLAERALSLSSDDLLIDFGCGIGRMAKEMIARTGCRVIGVDISTDQRCLAPSYVRSERFAAVSPEIFIWLVRGGLKAHGVLAVWVLQHVLRPELDLDVIEKAMVPGARMFVANEKHRCVPVTMGEQKGWVNDGRDVRTMLRDRFDEPASGIFSVDMMPESHTISSFWATYQKR